MAILTNFLFSTSLFLLKFNLKYKKINTPTNVVFSSPNSRSRYNLSSGENFVGITVIYFEGEDDRFVDGLLKSEDDGISDDLLEEDRNEFIYGLLEGEDGMIFNDLLDREYDEMFGSLLDDDQTARNSDK